MLKLIKLKDIRSKGNVREGNDEDLLELASDISKNGLLQPLVVREIDAGKYELIAGHRRHAALKMLNEELAECNVIDAADNEIIRLQIAENIQRRNMSACELVEVFNKFNKTQAQLAKMFNKSQSWVAQQYMAVRELESVYGRNIPDQEKKKGSMTILRDVKAQRTGEAETINCRGFRVVRKGHDYKITFDTYEAEKEFKKFIGGFKI